MDSNVTGPVDRWGTQLRKGSLELAILAVLWSRRLYGLEILQRLEARSNLVLSEGTIYPLLSRLNEDGLVRAEWVEAQAGHPRKYYSITPGGRKRAVAMAEQWTEYSETINSLIRPLTR